MGCSILSAHSVADEVARGNLLAIPIGKPGITRGIDLSVGIARRHDPAVQAVREVAARIVREGLAAGKRRRADQPIRTRTSP